MSFLVNSSFGADDPERATVPFILACSAANTAKDQGLPDRARAWSCPQGPQ